MRLTAKYVVELENGHFLVCRALTDKLRFRAHIDEFDVELCLNPDAHVWRNLGHRSESGGQGEPYQGHSKIAIAVSREEQEELPKVPIRNGTRDTRERQRYFEDRRSAYRATAWKALDRVIRFFQYKLHNPLLSPPGTHSKAFVNPRWEDETGRVLETYAWFGVGTPLPDRTSFGVTCLTASHDGQLVQALEQGIQTELHEELLADAQTAIFQGNLRRGALEMAMACEVAVKEAFFATSTHAGAAYEYLESKQKVTVSVPELIDGVARQAFGASFKAVHSADFKNIDYLFRCRNKIAHRGEAWYRDDKGARHDLTWEHLRQWWSSVEELLAWLHSHAR